MYCISSEYRVGFSKEGKINLQEVWNFCLNRVCWAPFLTTFLQNAFCCCIYPSFVWDKLLWVYHRGSSLKKSLPDHDKRLGVPRITELGVCGFLGQNLFMVPMYALIQKHPSALYFRSTGFKTLFALKINFHISTHIEFCCLPYECEQMVCRKETPPVCSEFQFSESIICLALVRSQLGMIMMNDQTG